MTTKKDKLMRKKVSVEVLRRSINYIIDMELFLERIGMEITESRRKIGSIFGYLDEDQFEKVEARKEILGVFEVERLPGELPLLPGDIGPSLEAVPPPPEIAQT